MMDLSWYILGVLTCTTTYASFLLSRRYPMDWVTWTGLGTGSGLVLFSIAWAAGAILEGVPRAASMGLLFFALPGIAVLTLTGRMILSRKEKAQ